MNTTSIMGSSRSGGRELRAFLLASGACLGVALLSAPAYAQDASSAPAAPAADASAPAADANAQADVQPAAAPAAGQEIVVTGSRIARRDFEANSPIVTQDRALFEQSSTSSIESSLNKLPQFTPANRKTPTTAGGDIQPTARNTPGSASVSLRGLGSNRTLVLVNGRRATPADAMGTVDINTIPASAIERVEIITGGASATYGADAVAGVTNFIMKQKFTGLELDGQLGLSEQGDAFEYSVSGIMGTDFAEGRGNMNLAFSLNDRKIAYQRDRQWYRDVWSNPNIGGSGFFPSSVSGIYLNDPNNPVDQGVMNSIFSGAASQMPNKNLYIFANPDGSVFSGVSGMGGANSGAYRNQIVDGYNYKMLSTGLIAPNFTDAPLISPATRYNMLAQGNYEINDWLTAFAQGNFSNTSTRGIQEGAPVVNGWGVKVNYNHLNPQADLPAEMVQILNARANPDAPFTIYQMLPFNRETSADVYSYNMTAGLRGKIPGSDWTFEVFASQGKTQSTVTQKGFGSLQRYQELINYGNFGQGFTATGNSENGGFGGSTATCTSGLNPFSGAPVSEDCLEAIRADIKTKSTMEQSIWEADLQGKLVDLPAGELRLAVGASHRTNDYTFENDTLTTQGRSFLEQAIGLYPSGNSEGRIVAKEAYAELLVPIIHNTPFIEEFNLELGGRISDYNTTGTSYTYKVLGDWKVNDWLRFRGGFNRAERAPNVAELFLAPEQSFATATNGDACSINNAASYSANPAANSNAAQVRAMCEALMARSGNANAATTFYGNAAAQGAGSSYVFPTLIGNPNLKPEKANTWTAGVVINSPFRNTPLLQRLRLTVDYYNLQVNDAIAAQSPDILQQQCFDPTFNPTFDPTAGQCANIARNVDGTLGNLHTTFLNNGRFRTSGIDTQLDWSVPAGPGQINLNAVFNYLISMKSSELSTLPMIEYAGTLGPSQNGLDGGSYRWKLFTTLGYSIQGYSLALQWRHLPAVESAIAATRPNTTIGGYPSYDVFSLMGTAGVTDRVTFRFGVDNLFNKAPPLGGIDSNPAAGLLAGGSINAQYYDVIGRRFYIGLKTKF